MTQPSPRQHAAYTLIELLVVVAIIVTLLAILMPSLNKAVDASHRAVCASNMHQTGIAHLQWAGDHYGSLVEGQPAYDWAGGGGSVGHYAVWYRNWANPPRAAEYGGKYLKHGALARTGYLPDGKTFYCPSWTGTIGWQRTGSEISGSPGGGWFEDEADIPAAQVWMQTTYHYNSQFGSNLYRHVAGWRSAKLSQDSGSAALMADAFSDPTRGVDLHHRTGYNVLFLNGSVAFHDDPANLIRDLWPAAGGGQTYHAGQNQFKEGQSLAWRTFERRDSPAP